MSEQVKRYDLSGFGGGMLESEDGAWYHMDDYDALRAELEALRSQHAERQEAVAWRLRLPDGRTTLEKAYPKWAEGEGDGYAIQPLYTSPPSAQDVSGLVEALEHIAGSETAVGDIARSALAAYRNPATVKRCPTCTGTCTEICAKARP